MKAPSIFAEQEPSFVESYTDVTARTFDSGRIHKQTLKAFEGTALTENGLVPHSGLSVGTHTVSGMLAGYASIGKSLSTSAPSRALMLDQADQQSEFLDVYTTADSAEVRAAIVELQQRGGNGVLSKYQGDLEQLLLIQSEAFIGVVPDPFDTDGVHAPENFSDNSDSSNDDSDNDESDTGTEDEAAVDKFFEQWNEFVDWLTGATDDVLAETEDYPWLNLFDWMESQNPGRIPKILIWMTCIGLGLQRFRLQPGNEWW